MEILVIILIGIIIFMAVRNSKNQKKINDIQEQNLSRELPIKTTEILPYKKKLLLTKNEWIFYKSLKPVADELGYCVLAKVRLADLIEVSAKDNKEYMKYFNKINRKHIDFVLAKPENLQILLLIELDDNSHNEAQRERDEFIEKLYKQTGYKLLRTKGEADLKLKIEAQLNDTKSEG